jgi:hypothetical protein
MKDLRRLNRQYLRKNYFILYEIIIQKARGKYAEHLSSSLAQGELKLECENLKKLHISAKFSIFAAMSISLIFFEKACDIVRIKEFRQT